MKISKEFTALDLLRALGREARAYTRRDVIHLMDWLSRNLNFASQALRISGRLPESQRVQWRRVLSNSPHWDTQLPPLTGPRVLFLTTFGLDWNTTILDSLLMMSLRLRGAHPTAVVCDSAIPACEFNRYGCGRPPPEIDDRFYLPNSTRETCQACVDGITRPYSVLPVEIARLSVFSQPDDLQRLAALADSIPFESYWDFFYKDIHVGEHAYATTARALLRGTLEDTLETRWQYRRYLISSMLIVDLMHRIMERHRPERFVASHGIYVTQGTMVDVASSKGIPCAVAGSPYRSGTVSFFQGDNCHRALHAEPNTEWEHLKMTHSMAERLDRYMIARRGGSGDHIDYQRDAIGDHASIRQMLGIASDRPLIALFTNLLWDAQIMFKSKVYPDMLTWLFETIRYFSRRPELQLVIRVHPVEGPRFSRTAQPLTGEIERMFPRLPENIFVARPDSGVNSYALADMSVASLIYGAQWGFEIAMLGTPVIITGESPNRHKGFTYDPDNKEEYLQLLNSIPDLPKNSSDMVERARLYAYHFHFRLSIDLPQVQRHGTSSDGRWQISVETLDDLFPGRHGGLDAICCGIIDGQSPFVYDQFERSSARR